MSSFKVTLYLGSRAVMTRVETASNAAGAIAQACAALHLQGFTLPVYGKAVPHVG